tara:strand:- start:5806 stop:6399 length:594 start_codon:yes stop_codon:yes gene_type:complete
MKINMYGYMIILFIVLISLKIYYESDVFNLRCIISSVDGKKYCVRERNKLQQASNLLATVTGNMKELVSYMGEKYSQRDNVKRLVENFNPRKIHETLPTSEYTAYSENKGEKLAFCLNSDKNNNEKLIDKNTLTFVAIHELSHLMTASIGHNDEFWRNFKFLLENAVKLNIYNPIDYKNTPQKYCGMNISDNPYYDI